MLWSKMVLDHNILCLEGLAVQNLCSFLFFLNSFSFPMSDLKISSLSTQTVTTSSSQTIADTVWQFMTSIKSVIKRDGQTQDFDAGKLHASIKQAMHKAGIHDTQESQRVTQHVLTRLTKTFDGHTTPHASDIRDIAQATFIDHNLVHVAKVYATYRMMKASQEKTEARYGNGLIFERFFNKEGIHPYEAMEWEIRDAVITDSKGKVVFEQKNVEVPKTWSQTATNIVVSKYFRGQVGMEDREISIKQLIDRVAKTITNWARQDGYFQAIKDGDIFEAELTHILVNQMAAFNSPVWFNVGVYSRPQCSACFINSVQDDMRSILHLAVTEGMLFKGGSGTGTNLSKLRSSHEYLGGSNGKASGPVSFMRGLDAFAGVIKSGGKTRRAAKMVILDV